MPIPTYHRLKSWQYGQTDPPQHERLLSDLDVRKYWHLVQQSDSRFFGSDPVPPDDLASARQPYPCHQSLLSELHRFSRQSSSGAGQKAPASLRAASGTSRATRSISEKSAMCTIRGCPKDVLCCIDFAGSFRMQGISAKTVYRFCRKSDQFTLCDQTSGLFHNCFVNLFGIDTFYFVFIIFTLCFPLYIPSIIVHRLWDCQSD